MIKNKKNMVFNDYGFFCGDYLSDLDDGYNNKLRRRQ